jgi:hypothetical protein
MCKVSFNVARAWVGNIVVPSAHLIATERGIQALQDESALQVPLRVIDRIGE